VMGRSPAVREVDEKFAMPCRLCRARLLNDSEDEP
jgi:predicted Zn-dependent protease